MDLPVASAWFRVHRVDDRLTLIDEPHAHEFVRGNIWWFRGADRDLVVDTGLGVASLRAEVPDLYAHDPMAVLTHGHLDHAGGAAEFADVRAHPGDAVAAVATLDTAELLSGLGASPEEGLPIWLVDAVPHAGWHPRDYRITKPEVTPLTEGDVLDLGDRSFVVLHTPGHTPGEIALWDEAAGELATGDLVYDDVLLDDLHESDRTAYAESLRRLLDLDVRVVRPGHGESFDGDRLRRIVRAYLR